jgi:hypothetical protein
MTEAQHAAAERNRELNDTPAELEDLPPESFPEEEYDPGDLKEQQDFAGDDGFEDYTLDDQPFSDFGDDF